jgi:hypothetical protein
VTAVRRPNRAIGGVSAFGADRLPRTAAHSAPATSKSGCSAGEHGHCRSSNVARSAIRKVVEESPSHRSCSDTDGIAEALRASPAPSGTERRHDRFLWKFGARDGISSR